MSESKLVIRIQNDGTVKIDARGVKGSAEQIMAQLKELAAEVGGELTVEKHVETHHHHHQHDNHDHEHN